jgi:predicted nucleic acid-binding protein
MPNVISNTSCLIALSNINMLEILQKRYNQIIVTPEVASETDNPLLILDDGKARRYAKSMDLNVTGTLGVIIKSYELGLIEDALSAIKKLKSIGFRVPNDIENELINNS